AEPARPLLLERAHVLRLREDRVILAKELDYGVEVFAEDVVLHQRPGEFGRGRGASGRHVRPSCRTGRWPVVAVTGRWPVLQTASERPLELDALQVGALGREPAAR